jgi:hypothetical protein
VPHFAKYETLPNGNFTLSRFEGRKYIERAAGNLSLASKEFPLKSIAEDFRVNGSPVVIPSVWDSVVTGLSK